MAYVTETLYLLYYRNKGPLNVIGQEAFWPEDLWLLPMGMRARTCAYKQFYCWFVMRVRYHDR